MSKVQISFTTTAKNQKGLEEIADEMGMSLSSFLTACATQIRIHRGLPYPMQLPKVPLTSHQELETSVNRFMNGYRGERHDLIE